MPVPCIQEEVLEEDEQRAMVAQLIQAAEALREARQGGDEPAAAVEQLSNEEVS